MILGNILLFYLQRAVFLHTQGKARSFYVRTGTPRPGAPGRSRPVAGRAGRPDGLPLQILHHQIGKGVNDLPQSKLEELAAALDTTPAWLLGIETAAAPPPGFEPLPEMARVPLVGSIACGTPITAEQNIESYIGVPAAWHADFALTCHGSSMAPTICDGDIVCIRRQPEVEQGEIAAVRIGDEATLKHFHRQGSTVMLLADNAAVCPPMIYAGSQLEEIQIEGRAVGFCRGL